MKNILIICCCFFVICLLTSCSFVVDDKDNLYPQKDALQVQTQEGSEEQTKKEPDETVDIFGDCLPTLKTQGEYFSEYVLKNSDGGNTYIIEVYDKNGNVVLARQGERLSVYEIKVSDQESVVSISYGDGKTNYYNTLENRFSKNFPSESIWDVTGRTIVCVSEKEGKKYLEIRDIFDSTKLYRVYDHEMLDGSVRFVRLSQDGKSVSVKYSLNNFNKDITKVICFEPLPILKTQKNCYVRTTPDLNSGYEMVSSGVRAVLRTETNDTVRLLSDGTIVGGEYTSDDGTVRNDWYCIDYRGEVRYVTADSFEMGYSADIPTEEKTPYSFISEQERLSWKDKIIKILFEKNFYEEYKELGHWFLGMALMDLNFDNTPELLAVYAGGSMGNVCIDAYDLVSGQKAGFPSVTPHYNSWDSIYLCVYRSGDGKYFIVNEGSLREGLESYSIMSVLSEDFKYKNLFDVYKTSDNTLRYYCGNVEVDREEYEKQKIQFIKDNEEIAETQIEFIYWDSIDAKNKSEAFSSMADALVNSSQEFIDFNN